MMNPLVAPLFVPANRPERFPKAEASGADAVIIDLEDSVAPQHKNAARVSAAAAADLKCTVLVRVNGADTPWHGDDLDFLADYPSFGVMIPKAESSGQVARVLDRLGERLAIPLIESGLGLQNCPAIAALEGVSCVALGPADLCLDLGCRSRSPILDHARATIVIASAAARKARPLDGPSFALDATEEVAGSAIIAKTFGFGGKLCIHPSQVLLTQQAFAPTPDEIAGALKLLSSYSGDGVALVNGAMVDRPLVEAAISVLRNARIELPLK